MGAAAVRLADRVVLTSDNPRGEDPLAIIEAIAAGAAGATQFAIDPDRAHAIEAAVQAAAPADVILVAGKGHETYQEIAGTRLPFSDAQVVERALASRSGASPGRSGASPGRSGASPGRTGASPRRGSA